MRKSECPCGRRGPDVGFDTVGTIRDTCKSCKRLYLLICTLGGVRSIWAHEAEAQAPSPEQHVSGAH